MHVSEVVHAAYYADGDGLADADADGLRDADGLTDALGLIDADGLCDDDGLSDGANFPKSSTIVVIAASRPRIISVSSDEGLADSDTDADGITVIAICGEALSTSGADKSLLFELYRLTMTF